MARALTVLLLTHYFPPEIGAPQSRLGFLTRALVRQGHRVEVLTSLPSYPSGTISPAYRGRWLVREEWQGARVTRTLTYARPGHTFLRRLLNYLSFSVSCFFAIASLPRFEVIFVESPPLFLTLSAALFRLIKGGKLVIHVSDLWVEAAVSFGYLARNSVVHRGLRGLEVLAYRLADALIVVSSGMIEDLASKSCPRDKIHVIPNGVDTETFRPGRDKAGVRRSLGLEGKFIALFTGTHGVVTDMAIFIEVARRLAAQPDVHFLFVGEGVEKPELVRLAREQGVGNMTFLEPQPEARLAEIIDACDVGLNSLKPVAFTEHIISVKVFGYMACGIPVICTDKQALREIILASGAGVLVPAGDPEAFATAILELYRDPERRREQGSAGIRWVAECYSRQIAADKTERLLLSLVFSRS